MRLRNLVLALTVMASVSIYVTLYTIEAQIVAANYIFEDPVMKSLAWRSGPSGSFFPWPKGSGPLQVLSDVNSVDSFIYGYLIESQILAAMSILFWFITGLLLLKILRTWHRGSIAPGTL